MVPYLQHVLINCFIFPVVSSFLNGKKDQRIDLANIIGLVSLTFFMTQRENCYNATHVTGIWMHRLCWRKQKSKSKEQYPGIIGANSSKVHLVNCNNQAVNEIQQYSVVKGRVPLPNVCFMLPLKLKDRYTLIEQLVYQVLLKLAFSNSTQLYNQLMINLAVAVHDVQYANEVY